MAIRTAIIGLGIMGRRMLEHMLTHPAYDPAFLWDPNPANMALARDLAPGSVLADSAEAAMAGADLVYLALLAALSVTSAVQAADALTIDAHRDANCGCC
ncbi:MAG: hypothetical protein B7X55_06795, partial [Rhodobacterales bacterium 34-62-10]